MGISFGFTINCTIEHEMLPFSYIISDPNIIRIIVPQKIKNIDA